MNIISYGNFIYHLSISVKPELTSSNLIQKIKNRKCPRIILFQSDPSEDLTLISGRKRKRKRRGKETDRYLCYQRNELGANKRQIFNIFLFSFFPSTRELLSNFHFLTCICRTFILTWSQSSLLYSPDLIDRYKLFVSLESGSTSLLNWNKFSFSLQHTGTNNQILHCVSILHPNTHLILTLNICIKSAGFFLKIPESWDLNLSMVCS